MTDKTATSLFHVLPTKHTDVTSPESEQEMNDRLTMAEFLRSLDIDPNRVPYDHAEDTLHVEVHEGEGNESYTTVSYRLIKKFDKLGFVLSDWETTVTKQKPPFEYKG